MTVNVRVGDRFPDIALPDVQERVVRLSGLTKPSLLDEQLGFHDGYPLIVVFYRGFFCPRDQQQFRMLVQFQAELAVNYGRLVAIGVDPPRVHAAFRAGLGADWPFLADEERGVVRQLGILDETEGEYAFRAQPYTFVLRPDLTIHAIYNGWFFVGRPTHDELRRDLRAIMEARADYRYEAYADPLVRRVRIPQQEWAGGAPPLGASGLPTGRGAVRWFDTNGGVGMIARDDGSDDLFFSFTAIPGFGYRTVRAGTPVRFEIARGPAGAVARNVQREPGDEPD